MRILYLAFADLAESKAWTVHIRATCRNLADLGHDVLLVTPRPSAPVRDLGLPWEQVPVPWAPKRALLSFHSAVLKTLPRWKRQRAAQLVYARMVPYAFWLPARAHSVGLPIAIEINGLLEDEFEQEGFSKVRAWVYRTLERVAVERADGVVAVSDALARRLREVCPGIRDLATVPNGVDVSRFPEINPGEARRLAGIPEGRWVGFVGAFFRSRSLPLLVRAMKVVRVRCPDARLILVGDGPARLEVEAESGGLEPGAVRFAGEVPPEQVPLLIGAMDVGVFLCTLPHHGTPIKLLEYLAAARPVVASSTTGTGVWVESEGAGISVDPASVESVASGILRLLENPGMARDMGRRGREVVRSGHTWRQRTQELASHLEKWIRRHAERGRG